MTAYTTISNLLVAVGAKPFATTVQALRDNPIAMFEGAAGAPRLALESLERITIGDVVKARRDATVSTLWSTPEATIMEVGFLQVGGVRLTLDQRHATGADTSTVRVKRWRDGTTTTLQTWTESAGVWTARTIDISGIEVGDTYFITNEASGSASFSEVRNMRFKTGGENLWPAPVRAWVEADFSV